MGSLALRLAVLTPIVVLACTAKNGADGGGSGETTGSSSGADTSVADDDGTTTSGTATGSGSASTTDEADTTSTDAETGSASGLIFDVSMVPDLGVMEVPPTDIDVAITADNAYAFGYGTEDAMLQYYGGIANLSAG